MQGNEEMNRTTGGLTTDDLARPSRADTTAPQGTGETAPKAPIYPGESTGSDDAGRPGTEAAPGSSDAAGTGADTRTGPGTAGTERAAEGVPDTGVAAGESTTRAPEDEVPQLLTEDEERGYRDRWQRVQSRFVDDPRDAVHDADALVADVMQTLAATFARHKRDLEGQWSQGERVSTEELRGALRRYRSFFNRLLLGT
ncbi:hypothetical protein [Streptomyces sp. NPDC002265]|uniref:hypothetical protein n=1 Tax=Streptomyces sp. NPDC002265 TaxID=3154415 RepID=UPI00332BF242